MNLKVRGTIFRFLQMLKKRGKDLEVALPVTMFDDGYIMI